MKKISTVLTLFALMLTLSACGGRDSVADAKGTMFDSINAAATLGEMVDVVICNVHSAALGGHRCGHQRPPCGAAATRN